MTTTASASSTAPVAARPYDELIELTKEATLLSASAALLSWDQQTMMPGGGLEYRSRQMAQLASLHHRAVTDPRVGECLGACESDRDLLADPLSAPAANVREIRRQYDRQTKLPTALVQELAQTTSLAQHEWAEARKASDFARFRPWLEKVVELTRRAAECLGWPPDGEPWDALAEDYEPGCTAAGVEAVFKPLRNRLQPLIADLTGSKRKPSDEFNRLELPIDRRKKRCVWG